MRRHFLFPGRGRIALNNAASTQPPRELLALYASLGPYYENVHREQSSASAAMTARLEESYDTIARFIGAPGPAGIALYRNATEAVNAVMYSRWAAASPAPGSAPGRPGGAGPAQTAPASSVPASRSINP